MIKRTLRKSNCFWHINKKNKNKKTPYTQRFCHEVKGGGVTESRTPGKMEIRCVYHLALSVRTLPRLIILHLLKESKITWNIQEEVVTQHHKPSRCTLHGFCNCDFTFHFWNSGVKCKEGFPRNPAGTSKWVSNVAVVVHRGHACGLHSYLVCQISSNKPCLCCR